MQTVKTLVKIIELQVKNNALNFTIKSSFLYKINR